MDSIELGGAFKKSQELCDTHDKLVLVLDDFVSQDLNDDPGVVVNPGGVKKAALCGEGPPQAAEATAEALQEAGSGERGQLGADAQVGEQVCPGQTPAAAASADTSGCGEVGRGGEVRPTSSHHHVQSLVFGGHRVGRPCQVPRPLEARVRTQGPQGDQACVSASVVQNENTFGTCKL